MDFADADAEKKCESGDAGDSQWRGSEQIMIVQGSGYFLYVTRLKSGYQSYVSEEEVGDFANSFMKDLLRSPSTVRAHAAVSGYHVATFSGKFGKKSDSDVVCFAFTRYGGVVLGARGGFSGAPGTANGLYGGYCAKGTEALSDTAIQQVLTDLRAPVD